MEKAAPHRSHRLRASPDLPRPVTDSSNPSAQVVARFEYEVRSKGNSSYKALLVELDSAFCSAFTGLDGTADFDPATAPLPADAWDISWDDMRGCIGTRDNLRSSCHQRLFLLPPGVPVPQQVAIVIAGKSVAVTKPMPAIFHPDVGLGPEDLGKKGVLHTMWARRRLAELDEEINAEMKLNGESVGLEIAAQEKLWIVQEFLPSKSAPEQKESLPLKTASPGAAPSRLGEKLRGLKLATTTSAHAPAVAGLPTAFSPHGQGESEPGSVPPGSTNGMDGAERPVPSSRTDGQASRGDENQDDDLFALPMSPRSPDMEKSPFSVL